MLQRLQNKISAIVKDCNYSRKTICILGILILVGSLTQKLNAQAENQKPNVLFIICDDLNDYLGAFNGHPQVKTPNIDRLSKSGFSFLNAHSNTPVCSPSRNSLFTGVYTHKSKDFGWTALKEQAVLKNNKTIMELFTENGYHVMGSGKLLHHHRKDLWHEWGVNINNYGPFAFNGTEPVGHPSVPKPFRDIGAVDGSFAPISSVPIFLDSISNGKRTGWVYDWEMNFMEYEDEQNRDLLPDEMHAEWAINRLKQMEIEQLDKPFFMGIGFVRPHTPLYAPKRFFDMFPIDKIELSQIRKGDVEDTYYKDIYPSKSKGLRYYRALKEAYGNDEELGLKHFLQAYLACVAFVDEQVGMVLDALEESKFNNNTIVVFTSDHGWQMGEKEYLFKNSPWQESIRVPLLVRAPNIKGNRKVEHPVSLIDIFPTLIDLCNLEGNYRKNAMGGDLGGYSLKPFLNNEKEENWTGPHGALSVIGVGLNKEDPAKQTYTYSTKNWRYIKYLNGEEELYSLNDDPFEWENLANDSSIISIKKDLHRQMMEIINK